MVIKASPNQLTYSHRLYMDGCFIKEFYGKYYTKKQLKEILSEEFYYVHFYEPDDTLLKAVDCYDSPVIATSFISIPEIDKKIFFMQWNTSSEYACCLCMYEEEKDEEEKSSPPKPKRKIEYEIEDEEE